MSDGILGIDLGTTNSVAAIAESDGVRTLPAADGQPLIPSVVSFHPNGNVLTGAEARQRRLIDPENTIYSIKRLIGRPFQSEEVSRAQKRFPFELKASPSGGVLVSARGRTYTLSEISALVLREVRTRAEAALGHGCKGAVVTVPANFNELQRSATKAAGRVAGLDVMRILNEPTAAALAYGYSRATKERIAIFDFGGGTFDVTILQLAGEVFEVLATAGDTYLGGDDIDVLIAERMACEFLESYRYDPRDDLQAFERLRAAAEWAKCRLSEELSVSLRVEELAYGPGGSALDLSFALERETLEAMARPIVQRTFTVCEDALRIANIRPSQLDSVILVGGATRMPLVKAMVESFFGKKPLDDVDPELVVAQGAAIQARALTTSRAPVAVPPPPPFLAASLKSASLQNSPLQNSPLQNSPLQNAPLKGTPDRPFQTVPFDIGAPPPPPSSALSPDPKPTGLDIDDEPTEVRNPSPALLRLDATEPNWIPPSAVVQAQDAVLPGEDTQHDGITRHDEKTKEQDLDSDESEFEPTEDFVKTRDVHLPGAERFQPPPPVPDAPALDVPLVNEPAASEPAAVRPPLLLDVTPLSLGIETVNGYCEHIIERNSVIPIQQARLFSTAQDNQEVVRVRVCQGESRRLEENQALGVIQLSGLRAGARGQVHIRVAFMIDSDGTLNVAATDETTGQRQEVEIQLIGGIPDEQILALKRRHESMFPDSSVS